MNEDKVIKIDELEFVKLIEASEINKRVRAMAQIMAADLAGKDPLFIVVLNGAFIFGADLLRQFDFECDVHFIKVSSYSGMESMAASFDSSLLSLAKGRTVVIIEDIVDSGQTIHLLVNACMDQGVKSVCSAAFLSKPSEWKHDVTVQYIGFEIPPLFVVGYGLDYNGKGRNLKDIYQIRPILN